MHRVSREAGALLSDYLAECAGRDPNLPATDTGTASERDWRLTANHCLRVEALAVQIARKTPAFPPGDLPLLRVAAIFHDIGQAGGRQTTRREARRSVEASCKAA
ncbi:MAG: HD domain-containing protein [Bacillota bacterium]|nr:HD domain-containing protein [Bacillota bacterium]